ncbi:MAG: EAL domain-containing protein [Methylotenera sp.]
MDKSLAYEDHEINTDSSTSAPEISSGIVDLLYQDSNKSAISTFVVAVILLFTLSETLSIKAASLWMIIMLIAYGQRIILVSKFFADPSRAIKAPTWLNRFNISTAICGLAWGAASFVIFPANSTELQAFLGLTLAGISAGGLIIYSIKSSTAISFVGSIAVLTVPAFLSQHSHYTENIMFQAGFFVIFVAFTSKRLAQGLLDNMSLRINAENQKQEIIDLTQKQNLHIEHTPMGVIEWDSDLIITSWNKACSNIFGYTSVEAVGKHISFLLPDFKKKSPHTIVQILLNQEENPVNLKKIHHKNGESVFVEWLNTVLKNNDGKIVGMASLVQDKTAFIKTQNKIHQLAYHDALTNLPNRGLLLDRLSQATSYSERSQTYGMVVYIDLDHFKTINDAKGHAAGDHLLITVSNRLQKVVRKQDTIARVGGDEFVLVLADIGKTSKEAHAFSQQIIGKIIQAIKLPVEYAGYRHQCSASTGVCLFMGDAISADELVRRADISMYLAKKQGRNSYQYYDETMQPKYNYQLELKNDLNNALVENQFQLHLQGQFNKDYRPLGAEVLLRWHHPKHGLVSPTDFIPLIEESGLVVPIGNWIIHQTCALLKKWEASPLTNKLTLSVNVSAVQFNHQNFISEVESAIQSSGCNATLLCIELTESAVINSIEDIVYKMNYLSSMGISLAIDDFGIGYSSLSILKRLPLNELKIDKSFLQGIAKGNVEGAIVQTILQMGKNLKLRIVAEGVETKYQLEYLQSYGCKVFQGYLFQKHCCITEFEKTLTLNEIAVEVI